MKISEYKQMMAYLTRPKTKGGEVKVRKPNAVPPKTKTIQKFSKGGPTKSPKVLFNQGTGKFEGLSPEDDLLFEGIEYDATLGKFVDSKTGKTGSLSDFTEVMKKKGTFEQIVDILKAKQALAAGDPFSDIRSLWAGCAACHGPTGGGGVGPMLAGQSATNIIDKL